MGMQEGSVESPVKLTEAEEEIGIGRRARRAYSFDDVALVPGEYTINPEDVDISSRCGGLALGIPFLAAAMDSVVDPEFAFALWKAGGLAVLNLLGLQTRYKNPEEALERIRKAPLEEATSIIQSVYQAPVQEVFIVERIRAMKKRGMPVAVSLTPLKALEWAGVAEEAGADLLFIQSTVTSHFHYTRQGKSLSIARLTEESKIPVIVGNCVSYPVAIELMRQGVEGVLVGVGPGAACTTRMVTGVGVPQVTATADVAAARDAYFQESGRYVPVITDGGMRTGGDVAKAFAAGADLVMMGSVFARTEESPGKGFHWGMATSDPLLPRGARIYVGLEGSLQKVLFGPANREDGTLNLVGALKNAMGLCGARTIPEMHRVNLVISPSLPSEGKYHQLFQRIGSGK